MTPSPTFGRRLYEVILKYGAPTFNQTSFDANRKTGHGKFTPLSCNRPSEDRPLLRPGLRRPNRLVKTWILHHRSSASMGSVRQRIRVSVTLKTAPSCKTCACRSITRSSRWFTWVGRILRSRKTTTPGKAGPPPATRSLKSRSCTRRIRCSSGRERGCADPPVAAHLYRRDGRRRGHAPAGRRPSED